MTRAAPGASTRRIENNFMPPFFFVRPPRSPRSPREIQSRNEQRTLSPVYWQKRPLSSNSQFELVSRGTFPGQQCASARMTAVGQRPPRFRKDDGGWATATSLPQG